MPPGPPKALGELRPGLPECLCWSLTPRSGWTLSLKRGALQSAAASSPPPSGRLTEPGFPAPQGSQGLGLRKMES